MILNNDKSEPKILEEQFQ